MTERGLVPDNPTTPNGEAAGPSADNRPEAMEMRVRRLEDAVATLQDTKRIEERVVERVSRRLKRESAQTTIQDSAEVVVNAGRKLLPAALNLIRTETDKADQQLPAATSPPRRTWLLFDAYAEARAMVRMFLDPRYRVSWQARFLPLALLGLIITSFFWVPFATWLPTPLMTIFLKPADLVLAFLAFKILSREVRLYRETVTDLPLPPRS